MSHWKLWILTVLSWLFKVIICAVENRDADGPKPIVECRLLSSFVLLFIVVVGSSFIVYRLLGVCEFHTTDEEDSCKVGQKKKFIKF